jgi:hypothetical protein
MKRAWSAHVAHRIATALVAAAAVASFAACGSDEDEGSQRPATESAASTKEQSPDERDIRATVSDLGAAMKAADGNQGCTYLSRAARKVFASVGGTCPAGFRQQLSASGVTEDFTPTVLAVEVEGAKATVKALGMPRASGGDAAEKPRRQQATFVKEDGKWKAQEWFRD